MAPGGLIALAALVLFAAASALLVALWTRTPHGRLDARTAVALKILALTERDDEATAPEALRERRKRSMRIVSRRGIPVARVEDRAVPGPSGPVPVRIYQPGDDGPARPVVVYFHGGGYVIGDLDTHDPLCRALARASGAIVVAVDYRRAPEHRFPAAVDDAFAALRWAGERAASFGGDPARIAVAGDSAGGTLATVTTILARDRGGPAIRAQALLYPGTDASTTDRPSYHHFARGYLLTLENMRWFYDQYLPDLADRRDPRASPLLVPDPGRLPPALVVTAAFDPLRDEGEEYARRLEAAGVPVLLRRYEGMVHGFLAIDRLLPQAREGAVFVAAFLRHALAAG